MYLIIDSWIHAAWIAIPSKIRVFAQDHRVYSLSLIRLASMESWGRMKEHAVPVARYAKLQAKWSSVKKVPAQVILFLPPSRGPNAFPKSLDLSN